MNRKQLVILILAGIVIGGIGYSLYKKDKASYQTSDDRGGQKLIQDFPINDITQVSIKHASNQVNLVKSEDAWKVKERGNYPANFTEVGDFLRKVWDLKPIQNIKVGQSQLGRLELAETGTNAGTRIDFKDKSEKTLKSLMLGKKYTKESGNSQFGGGDFPVGRYVMVIENQPKVWLINDAMTSIEPKPEQWLNKDWFKVEKIKSVSVTAPNATNSWRLTRESENGEFTLADIKTGEQYDTNKAGVVKFALSSPSFNDVLVDAKDALTNATSAQIQTFDEFTYEVKLAKASGAEENYHVAMTVNANIPKERTAGKDEKKEDKEKLDKEFQEKVKKLQDKLKAEKAYEKWTYVVGKWTVDPLLKERKDFMAEKKEEPKPGATPAAADNKDTPAPAVVNPPELPK